MEECRRLLSMKALDTSSLLTFLLGVAPDPSSLLGAPAPPVDLPDRLSLMSDRNIPFLYIVSFAETNWGSSKTAIRGAREKRFIQNITLKGHRF
jgi:hypothetical protein